jgi:hypothetical protein
VTYRFFLPFMKIMQLHMHQPGNPSALQAKLADAS